MNNETQDLPTESEIAPIISESRNSERSRDSDSNVEGQERQEVK